MKGIRFIPEDTKIGFMSVHLLAFAFSALLLIGSIALTVKDGLNFGIDFTGGTILEVKTPTLPDIGALRMSLNDIGLGSVSIQEFGAADDLLIRMGEQKGGSDVQKAAIDSIKTVLSGSFEGELDYRRVEFVGPQVGKELKLQGLYAILFSLVGILAYIWFRFEWQFGVAAISRWRMMLLQQLVCLR